MNSYQISYAYKAVIIVPVADLVGTPLKNASAYKHLPVCGAKPNAFANCRRLHQLRYLDVVEVTSEEKDQAQVTVSNLFFVPNGSDKKQTSYWTLKKNLYRLPDGEAGATLLASLPQPINFEKPTPPQSNVITLILPYYDATTGQTFSAGTRFVAQSFDKESATITVALLHPTTHQLISTTIPQTHCIFPVTDKERQRKNFVKLVRLWAHNQLGMIPYVWGGCSFVFASPELSFHEVATGERSSHYEIPDNQATPKTGFDCAGLVTGAAQAVGLPYFYKNTTTLASHLAPLAPGEHVRDGDLLWTPGHVMIASDCERNLLIEACGYASGWGRVREVALNQVFKNIETFEDLEKLFATKKPLKRIDKAGNVSSTYPTFKLLALDSIHKD